MRMTIDKAIEILNHYSDYPLDEVTEASLLAIETMRNSMNKINSLKAENEPQENGGEPLNAVDRGYHLAYEHLCEEIDNLLKENERWK